MREDDVVEITEEWLAKLPNVASVQRKQIIISGGLEADVVGYNSAGDVTHIIECKGSVGVTGIAQGIGQAYQYFYQKDYNEKAKDAEVLLVCPEDVSKKFELLHIPEGIKVFFVSSAGNVFERVRRRHGAPTVELQLPNTFYIRDCEINHFKDIILILEEMGRKTRGPLQVKDIENRIYKKRPDIAAKGYNHLITLRSIGAMGGKNRLTPKGYHLYGLIGKGDESFRREFCDYLYCFLINVMNALILIANEKGNKLTEIECTHKEIAEKICQVWGQTVRFMYDPRTISTAMRILSELGAIDYTDSHVKLANLVHAIYLPWGSRQTKLR